MAAEERPPGTSCSHALRDSQDPPPKGQSSWGAGWGTGGRRKGWSLQSPGREAP